MGNPATAAIAQSNDSGRIDAYFHVVHAALISSVIASGVGNDLVLAHPPAWPGMGRMASLPVDPAIYLG
ncbi:MAG TPA: hypothetical protein VE084_01535 [Burkholderiaceae bacterium]|nr:hypothetical protein [Burkholderiaceae bacterium]